MREPKYQVWDKSLEEMHQVYAIDWDTDGRVLTCHTKEKKLYQYDQESDCTGFILREYTGIKDKNGNEIYEWDIIKTEYGVINYVFFFDGGFGIFNPISNPSAIMFFSDQKLIVEVIGNIYQNPELIKK